MKDELYYLVLCPMTPRGRVIFFQIRLRSGGEQQQILHGVRHGGRRVVLLEWRSELADDAAVGVGFSAHFIRSS